MLANEVLRNAEYYRRNRRNEPSIRRVQVWYRAQLHKKKLQNTAVVRIQAIIRGVAFRMRNNKTTKVMYGSSRKSVRKECNDCLDLGLSDHNIRTWSDALSIVERGIVESLDEAVQCLQVSLHKTRRKHHEVPLGYVQHFLISELCDAKKIKQFSSVGFDKNQQKTPFLKFSCPIKKCNDDCIQVRWLVRHFEGLAKEALASGDDSHSDEFRKVASQLQNVELNAMHQLAPHRVTMCPGSCSHSSGMIVPPAYEEKVSRCGDPRCSNCIVTRQVATKVISCGECKSTSGNPLRWCVECGGDHGQHAKCDHKAKWYRLSEVDRELFNKQIAEGSAQHCPKCYLFVEKSDGCDKMTCSDCGTKFCLKCGDLLGHDYVTDHLFAVRGGMTADDLICRKIAVVKAFEGDDIFLREVVNAYTSGSRRIIRDVNEMAKSIDRKGIPRPLQDVLGSDQRQDKATEIDAMLAQQMMAQDVNGM